MGIISNILFAKYIICENYQNNSPLVKLQSSLRVHKVTKLYPVLSVLHSSKAETTVVIRVSRDSIPHRWSAVPQKSLEAVSGNTIKCIR